MIEFESVSKTYRDGTTAVADLNLQIPSDKISVIVGPSGCGKTTTLRMVNRMLEPSKGRILWDGNPLKSRRKTALRRQMGYVIQNGGLFPHRTVVDNVTTVPSLLGWDRTKARRRALELLRAVGLDAKLNNRYPAQLSGGQQQRVGVARALAADPIVLLMDEPFSAVDPVVRADLHELLLGLQGELSKTIVMITHDIDEAIKLGDQVAILRVGGHLAQVGPPQQLLDEPADDFVEGFVGKDRGYRALSFAPAGGLSLDRVKVVRDASSATGGEPVLVVDSDAKPVGWADRNRPGQVLGLGSAFDPESDTLRVALDSALTSPVGLAVAVSKETGRYAGTVTASAILAQVTQSRASIADQISGRQQVGIAPAEDAVAAEPAVDHEQPVVAADDVPAVDETSTPEAPVANERDGQQHGAHDAEPERERGAELVAEHAPEPEDEQQTGQVERVPDPTTRSEHEASSGGSTAVGHTAADEFGERDAPTLIRAPVDVPPEEHHEEATGGEDREEPSQDAGVQHSEIQHSEIQYSEIRDPATGEPIAQGAEPGDREPS